MDETETDDASIVGEACHIVAESPDGPRGVSDLVDRNKYSNLILLCNVHHKQIDDQPLHYKIEVLEGMKGDHEAWVKSTLNLDEAKLADDLRYLETLDLWSSKVGFIDWNNRMCSMVMAGQPRIEKSVIEDLRSVGPWLLGRVWPKRYPEVERAFENFRLVNQDLCIEFSEHSASWGSSHEQTRKFYKDVHGWDPENYKRLSKEFSHHVGLVCDLVAELTRAANYIADMIRAHVSSTFALDSGVALLTAGPYSDLSYVTYRCEYSKDDIENGLYPGLKKFNQSRFSREKFFGDPGELKDG
ncbi:hypothetical protein [Xanthomonas campestris]|uniref:hypothetical protein n=1 Tax=Xanthomonas campestris TaxID=339 RepID=UPI00388D0B28